MLSRLSMHAERPRWGYPVGSDSAPKTPPGLGRSGRKLWQSITSDAFENGVFFDNRELDWLLSAAKTADSTALLEAEMAQQSTIVKGAQGQPVANPLLNEIRQHRALQAQLLARVDLYPAGDTSSNTRSTAARRAAQARWSS